MMHWTESSINEIKRMRIPHRNYERARAEAMAALVAAAPGEVVCITGPSRGGKSRLASELIKLIVGDHPIIKNGQMPVVTVLASNCTNKGVFRTKDFAVHCLEAIQHPLYGMSRPDDPWGTARARLLDNTTESTLSDAFRTALKIRGTKYVIFDESQHVCYAQGGDKEAAAILDSWKSLAAKADVVLILVGAYPLIDVLGLCPHLLGRKHQIHLPRYYATEEDLIIYDQILGAYTSVVQLPPGVRSLREWNDLFYPDSLGCIGLLEGWLRYSLAIAGTHNAEFLEKEHLLAARKTYSDLKQIAAEIFTGEKALKRRSDDENELATVTSPVTSKPAPSSRSPKSSRKPFKRNPRRYPVGGRV